MELLSRQQPAFVKCAAKKAWGIIQETTLRPSILKGYYWNGESTAALVTFANPSLGSHPVQPLRHSSQSQPGAVGGCCISSLWQLWISQGTNIRLLFEFLNAELISSLKSILLKSILYGAITVWGTRFGISFCIGQQLHHSDLLQPEKGCNAIKIFPIMMG